MGCLQNYTHLNCSQRNSTCAPAGLGNENWSVVRGDGRASKQHHRLNLQWCTRHILQENSLFYRWRNHAWGLIEQASTNFRCWIWGCSMLWLPAAPAHIPSLITPCCTHRCCRSDVLLFEHFILVIQADPSLYIGISKSHNLLLY